MNDSDSDSDSDIDPSYEVQEIVGHKTLPNGNVRYRMSKLIGDSIYKVRSQPRNNLKLLNTARSSGALARHIAES